MKTQTRSPGRGSKGPDRPFAFWLHSLLGLKLCVVMLFVSLTGAIATISDELEWLFQPGTRASPVAEFSWQKQIDAARQAFPAYRFTYLSAGEGAYLATRIHAVAPDGKRRLVVVDPGTNRVTGESSAVTIRSFLRALHYYLFVPGDAIFYAIASLGFVLLASLITGVIIYKKFWRGVFRVPRWHKGSRAIWGDLHRLTGLWSLPFVFIIGLTCVWYLVERAMYRAGLDPEQTLEQMVPASAGAPLSLDEIVRQAEAAMQPYRVSSVTLPQTPAHAIVVQGQTEAWLVRDRANRVAVDPYTGAILETRNTGDQSALEHWSHMADPLHFGDFGGLWSKLLWVVFGLALCGLSLSGAVIYSKRMARRLGESGPSSSGLDFLGLLKWPSLAAVTVVPVAAFFLHWLPSF